MIIALALGALGGWLLYVSLIAGFFIFGGALGGILALLLVSGQSTGVRVVVGILAFLVGGALALVLTNFVLIIGTALEGASLLVLGCARLLSEKDFRSLCEAVSAGTLFDGLTQGRGWAIGILAAFLIIFGAGVCVQFRWGGQQTKST